MQMVLSLDFNQVSIQTSSSIAKMLLITRLLHSKCRLLNPVKEQQNHEEKEREKVPSKPGREGKL